MAVAVVATNSEMSPLAGDVTDAASSEDRDVDKERERETRNALLLLLLSVLLVAVAGPVAVWRSHAQPVLLVWRLSVLLCLCAAIWTRVLDATATRARAVLLCASCALALALCADAAAGPEAGALAAHLATHLAAGLLGCALAETGLSLLIMYFICAVLLYAMAYVIMVGIAAMIITWLAILGIPGFFGYCLYVYASVKAEVEARAAANEAGWKQKGSPTRLLQ